MMKGAWSEQRCRRSRPAGSHDRNNAHIAMRRHRRSLHATRYGSGGTGGRGTGTRYGESSRADRRLDTRRLPPRDFTSRPRRGPKAAAQRPRLEVGDRTRVPTPDDARLRGPRRLWARERPAGYGRSALELRHGFSDGLQHSSHQPAQARRHLAVPSRRRVQHVNCCETSDSRLGQLARTSGLRRLVGADLPAEPNALIADENRGITRSGRCCRPPFGIGPPGGSQHPGDALPAERAASRRAR